MLCHQHETSVPRAAILARDFTALRALCLSTIPKGSHPIRWACTSNLESDCRVEVGVLTGVEQAPPLIFDFAHQTPRSNGFNVALIIPTGIGATVGGHAGDAGPVARLLAGVADTLVTHPNVVSASDINEFPKNGLYVE